MATKTPKVLNGKGKLIPNRYSKKCETVGNIKIICCEDRKERPKLKGMAQLLIGNVKLKDFATILKIY